MLLRHREQQQQRRRRHVANSISSIPSIANLRPSLIPGADKNVVWTHHPAAKVVFLSVTPDSWGLRRQASGHWRRQTVTGRDPAPLQRGADCCLRHRQPRCQLRSQRHFTSSVRASDIQSRSDITSFRQRTKPSRENNVTRCSRFY